MILQKIIISNFRQYRNTTIDVPQPDENGHVTIVVGRMGYGKTNILNAINWCLYGKEPHLGLARKALPMLNSVTKISMASGEQATVEVKLVFLDEGKRTEISRKAIFLKNSKGNVKLERINGEWSRLSVGYLEGKDFEYYQYPELYIERVMPEVLSSYFMFDGEKLDKYFLEQTVSKIRGAIHGISKLDLFDKVVERLQNTKKSFDKSYRDRTPEMKLEQGKMERLAAEIEECENKQKKYDEEEAKLINLKSDLDSALRSSSIEVIREKQKRRDGLDKQKEEAELRLEEHQDLRRNLILREFILATSGIQIGQALSSISEVQKSDELPAPFRTNFIEGLLEKAECICGRKIEVGSGVQKTLQTKMKANITRERTSSLLPLLVSDLHELGESRMTILDSLTSIESSIEEYSEKLEAIGKELEQIHKEIKEFDNVDISLLETREAEVRQQLERLSVDRVANIGVMKDRQRQHKEAETKLDQYRRAIDKYAELNKRKDLCTESLNIGMQISEQVLDSIRAQVDEVTSEEGLKAINDPKVQSITIGSDFMTSVKIRGYEHEEGIGGLSAGQRASLALSFLHALNSVSVWETPIIIDTPLGRIDLDDREPLVNVLRDQMKGKQIIIFATSAEYTPQERKALLPVVKAEYEIATSEVTVYGGP
jgi:DNA sulfur modification protein DndD